MKAKKLIGSIALTAALAMGTMPAFAAPQTTNWDAYAESLNAAQVGKAMTSDETDLVTINKNAPKNEKDATGSTKIFASIYDADINVTVPVAMAVAFGNSGLTDMKLPTNYKVTNNSKENPVHLVNVKGSSTTFKLSAEELTSVTGTDNELFINLGDDFAKDIDGDGVDDGVGLSNTEAVPTTAINMKGATPIYQFTFGPSKAAIGTPLSVGYMDSAVATMNLLFAVGDAS